MMQDRGTNLTAALVETDADGLHAAPKSTPVGRLDEVKAARDLNYACL